MTIYEHAMFGWTLTLATGCHRRHGWSIAGMAALAASAPDLDGLSLLFGAEPFARIHRVWFHNVLIATTLGLLIGVGCYLARCSIRVQRCAVVVLARVASDVKTGPPTSQPFSGHDLTVWVVVGMVACLTHLPADLIYNGGSQLPPWPVPLAWPVSERGWQFPMVPWGDPGTAVLMIVEMFALYCWPARAQLIALLTLAALAIYVTAHWLLR